MSSTPRKILIVSQMYPSTENPDLGIFVRGHEDELRARGHDVSVVAVTRRGGGLRKHLGFAFRALFAIMRTRPDIVYAHFLAPAGALSALACLLLPRAALVVVAHGSDVRNIGVKRSATIMMRLLERRADHVFAVSKFLAEDLTARAPKLASRMSICDAGVDLQHTFVPRPQSEARAAIGDRWQAGSVEPAYLFVGTLDERKNVIRLARAFLTQDTGTLTFVGDGPDRAELEALAQDNPGRIFLAGRVEHHEVATWMQATDILCLPSIVEPFGQVLIEAMGCESSVIATKIGGPPEFVDAQSGILVAPENSAEIADAIRKIAEFPRPNPHARAHAMEHDIARRIDVVESVLQREFKNRQ